jgi:hypothetical protein
MSNGPDQLREALQDIVDGRIVKRSLHTLQWNRRDVSGEFVDVLQQSGYTPMYVQDVNVEPGERTPAFYLHEGTAYFGWIFWEKFTEKRQRKLFGSVIRNEKGDWAIQISPQRKTTIYVNSALKTQMDQDHPTSL